MKNTKFVTMGIVSSILVFTATSSAQARRNPQNQNGGDGLSVTVTDITPQSTTTDQSDPTIGGGTVCDPMTDPTCILPDPINPTPGFGRIDLGTILTIGQKVWDFIVAGKPNAEYKTMKASVLPGGATNFAQLKGWSKPVAKVFRVEFKNIFGKPAGGFEYRLVFIHGGSYQGKGKYIGQISFAPLNILLKTDRTLNVKAEILEPLNFGSEEDPVAGVQLQITWSTNTTLRYNMNSIEYFVYGTGEIQDISNGNMIYQ